MSPVALSTTLLALAIASVHVSAQTPEGFVPLADKKIPHDQIPYMVDTDNGIRGPQSGFNQCNSTTENQNSLCQTSYLNHLDDFCLWAPSKPNSLIADTEGEEVAWCSKPGHGTRLIPAGALQGVQFLNAPGYIQVTGFIDQSKINIQSDDTGGELDPHGADLRGNPMGAVEYSNFWSNDNNTYTQVIEWHNFMGSNSFCFKACKPGDQAASLCQHIYDRIGVQYNCPNQAVNGTFMVCDSDNQDPPGIYTENGQVLTYTQPAESLGAISTMPYDPKVPASSNCRTFASTDLYQGLPTPTGGAAASSTPTGSGSASGSSASSGSKTSSAGAAPTGSSSSDNSDGNGNGSGALGVSILSTFAGVVAAVAFLA